MRGITGKGASAVGKSSLTRSSSPPVTPAAAAEEVLFLPLEDDDPTMVIRRKPHLDFFSGLLLLFAAGTSAMDLHLISSAKFSLSIKRHGENATSQKRWYVRNSLSSKFSSSGVRGSRPAPSRFSSTRFNTTAIARASSIAWGGSRSSVFPAAQALAVLAPSPSLSWNPPAPALALAPAPCSLCGCCKPQLR